MSFLLGLKAKLIGAGIIILTVLAYIANHKRTVNKLEKTKKKLVSAKADAKFQKDVNILDNEVHDQVTSHRADLIKDLKDGKRPKNISDPNNF
jgi:hypothetical protein